MLARGRLLTLSRGWSLPLSECECKLLRKEMPRCKPVGRGVEEVVDVATAVGAVDMLEVEACK